MKKLLIVSMLLIQSCATTMSTDGTKTRAYREATLRTPKETRLYLKGYDDGRNRRIIDKRNLDGHVWKSYLNSSPYGPRYIMK